MSMTQIAIIKKSEIPTKKILQDHIVSLGYNFSFENDSDNFENGIICKFYNVSTYLETYINSKEELLNDYPELEQYFNSFDCGISFIWGADFAAGGSIALISLALIDLCKSFIYYTDDEMIYNREMLIADVPEYIKYLNEMQSQQKAKIIKKESIWEKIKKFF